MFGRLNSYQKTAIVTVFATLFLILVGGLVRATGAGLGCPDWPKCFGSWIPPTSVEDLPPEFDRSQFNVVKTWIEYVNRLVGVAIGLLIILTFWRSFRYWKTRPAVVYTSAAVFVLVLFQGWLGGQVVFSELAEWLITLHMLLAMVIMILLIYATFLAMEAEVRQKLSPLLRSRLTWLFGGMLAASLIQMVLGTQVREQIDFITNTMPDLPREVWIGTLDKLFLIHRSFSWLILAAVVYLAWMVRTQVRAVLIRRCAFGLFAVVIAQIVGGVGMEYLEVPPALQVLHLVLSAVMVCLAFFAVLLVRRSEDPQSAGQSSVTAGLRAS